MKLRYKYTFQFKYQTSPVFRIQMVTVVPYSRPSGYEKSITIPLPLSEYRTFKLVFGPQYIRPNASVFYFMWGVFWSWVFIFSNTTYLCWTYLAYFLKVVLWCNYVKILKLFIYSQVTSIFKNGLVYTK